MDRSDELPLYVTIAWAAAIYHSAKMVNPQYTTSIIHRVRSLVIFVIQWFKRMDYQDKSMLHM